MHAYSILTSYLGGAADAPKLTDWIMAVAAVVNAFFSFALVLSGVWLFRETRRLAKGAEDQLAVLQLSVDQARRAADAASAAIGQGAEGNDLTRKAMIIGQRPWIEIIEATVVEDIVFERWGTITYEIRAKNVGNSPAMGLMFIPFIELTELPTPKTLIRVRHDDFGSNDQFQKILFPDRETTFRHVELVTEARLVSFREGTEEKRLKLSLTGFVQYKSHFGDERYRSTFAFLLGSSQGALSYDPTSPRIRFSPTFLVFRRWIEGWSAS